MGDDFKATAAEIDEHIALARAAGLTCSPAAAAAAVEEHKRAMAEFAAAHPERWAAAEAAAERTRLLQDIRKKCEG